MIDKAAMAKQLAMQKAALAHSQSAKAAAIAAKKAALLKAHGLAPTVVKAAPVALKLSIAGLKVLGGIAIGALMLF